MQNQTINKTNIDLNQIYVEGRSVKHLELQVKGKFYIQKFLLQSYSTYKNLLYKDKLSTGQGQRLSNKGMAVTPRLLPWRPLGNYLQEGRETL